MRRLTLSLVLLLSLFSWQAKALTLDEAQSLAQEQYPLMRDYNLIELTSQYTVENAAKSWLPQLSLGAQATWQTAVASYPDVLKEMLEQRGLNLKGTDKFQYKATLDVNQLIWDGGRIKAQQETARKEAEENRLNNEVEMYKVRCTINDIYFGLLLLEQQSHALDATITLLNANLDRVNALVHNGAAMSSDADAIEAELLSTKQQLTSVEASASAYRAVLSLYIGERAKEELTEPKDMTLPASNNSSMRPEQLLLTARSATLTARENEVKASVMPQIGAFAQGYFGYPGMNFMESMMNHKPSFNAMIGLSASWNINSLYTKKNKLLSLQVSKDRLDVARDVFERNTDIQATQQRSEINRLKQISESDAQIVALRARVRQASEARLREGIVEPTDLLTRITDEKNAVIAANSHHIEYLQALYQLHTTLNYDSNN